MVQAKLGNVNRLWESPVPDKVVSFLAYTCASEYVARDVLTRLYSETEEGKQQLIQQLGIDATIGSDDVMPLFSGILLETYKLNRLFAVEYSVEAQPSIYSVALSTPIGRIEKSIPIQTPNNPMMSCMMGVALAEDYVARYVSSRLSAGARKGTALENMVNSLAQVTHSVLPNIRRMIGGK